MRASSEELALRHAVDQCLPSGGVVVGVSGGADSLALLAATQWVAEHRGDPLTAVVVDHGLQVNSWTVDDPATMADLVSWGIDGLCTNVPDVALAVLAGRA